MTRVLWIVLASLAISALLTNGAAAQGFASKGVAATVNGEAISEADVEQILRQDAPPVHPLTQAQQRELHQMALDMLINDVLMRQFLAKNTPAPAAADIQKEIGELKQVLAKKNLSFEKFLKDSRQTPKTLQADITARLQWKWYVQNRLPDTLVKPYYDANKVFFDKVHVKASHILIRAPKDATPAQKEEIQKNLLAVRLEIVQGKMTFAEAARKYSHCTVSKSKGGDIGFFPYKFVVAEPIARAAFDMKKGDVSGPIETAVGWHIITVTDRTKGEPSSFEEIKDAVRQVYAQEVQLYQSIIAEQRKKAKIEINNPS